MKSAPALSPNDRVGRAVSLLHRLGLAALVVTQEASGRPVGIFTEERLLAAWGDLGEESKERLSETTVGEVMLEGGHVARSNTPLAEIVPVLRAGGCAAVAVVDLGGRYIGIITRKEVAAALCHLVNPGHLAGMATPLGVYLTNGSVRAGTGDFGLVLAGGFLALLWTGAELLVSAISWAVQHWSAVPLLAIRDGSMSYPGKLYFGLDQMWLVVFFVAQLSIFFLLMRIMPLSGTHGAEHLVVHAIENWEELTPEAVLNNTTVHPRCGTNLAAMMMVLGAGIYYFDTLQIRDTASTVFYSLLIVFIALLLRRRIGGLLQRLVTTRRPSRKQLEAAISVGEQLLERCRMQQGQRSNIVKRIWSMGLVQVLFGAGVTIFILQTAGEIIMKLTLAVR